MSIVIVGGNERMTRQYIDLCESYQCTAKVFSKCKSKLKGIGKPDLMVLFTSTVSHKMVRNALSEVKGQETMVARSHTSSICALKNILEQHLPSKNKNT